MAVQAPRVARHIAPSDVTLLVVALGVASAIELAVLRLFTRTAIHIPALEQLQRPYDLLSGTGRYAYFVALGLILPVLALLAVRIAATRKPGRWLAVLAIGVFAVAVSLAAVLEVSRTALDVTTLWAVAVLCAGCALVPGWRRTAAPATCFAAAFLLSGGYALLPALVADSRSMPDSLWMLDGAELFGVAFAASAPFLATGRIDRRSVVIAVAVAAVVLVAFLGNGATSRILLLWNIGLTGTLPAFVYAGAAGALALAGLRLLRSGSPIGAAGILLLVTGGIGFHSSYQSALVVAGLAAIYLALSDLPDRGSGDGRMA